MRSCDCAPPSLLAAAAHEACAGRREADTSFNSSTSPALRPFFTSGWLDVVIVLAGDVELSAAHGVCPLRARITSLHGGRVFTSVVWSLVWHTLLRASSLPVLLQRGSSTHSHHAPSVGRLKAWVTYFSKQFSSIHSSTASLGVKTTPCLARICTLFLSKCLQTHMYKLTYTPTPPPP